MRVGLVQIKRGREKPIRNRHPWIYSGAIAHAESAVDGELVTVVDHKNRFLARGCWNSKSQIQVRVMTWQDEPVDDAWWRRMLQRAIKERAGADAGELSARRLVNAENDFMPGLIIDRYADWHVLVAQTLFIDKRKERIVDALAAVSGADKIYERSDIDARAKEGLQPAAGALRGGAPPSLIDIEENGVCFGVDIQGGHKTGFYLDQRDNRRALAELANRIREGAQAKPRLLNLFSYSGGFAVSAGGTGGIHSINVDSSYAALELAEANFKRNGCNPDRRGDAVELIQADAFDYLRHCLDERLAFDMIVLDPPKFAGSKAHVQRAARGYKNLNLNAFKLLKEGGYLMTFSCSGAITRDLFQKIVFGALVDSGREAQVVAQLGAAADHPVALTFPEGEYLKGLLLRVY
ncbi:MAG: class I SAM-dependent rRNA methyltransferase [Chloroflexota bacterium]|nr:class I SAM-dependent rRNA methyltransferase [Chloroflexota bacterium]